MQDSEVGLMYEYVPKVIGSVPIVEVRCPICDGDMVEPLSETEDTWECCRCGMQFEVI